MGAVGGHHTWEGSFAATFFVKQKPLDSRLLVPQAPNVVFLIFASRGKNKRKKQFYQHSKARAQPRFCKSQRSQKEQKLFHLFKMRCWRSWTQIL